MASLVKRRQDGGSAAGVQPLEPRRLMSLVVQVEQADGSQSATVSAVGQTVQLDVVAIVTGSDATPGHDALGNVTGSFVSAAVGGGMAVAGNLSAANAAPFGATGSQPGTAQDLNGDGNLDVGSTDTTTASAGGYFSAHPATTVAAGTAAGGSETFVIGTVAYTVTSLNAGQQTNINFVPRDVGSTGAVAANWVEDAAAADSNSATFRAGSPFQVYTATSAGTTGSVTATAYADANGNGVRDAAEPVLAGATVYVDLTSAGQYAPTDPSGQTDATGAVTIAGVPTGTYPVRQVPPANYVQSAPAAGSAGFSTDVPAGTTTAAGAFGDEPAATITGTLYADANGNGADDAGEAAQTSATVYLDLNGNGTEDAGDVIVGTDAAGNYRFGNLAPGTYAVRETVPSGYAPTQPSAGSYTVVASSGQTTAGEDFGIAPYGSVTGSVYDDADNSGTRSAGEAGLAGVTVYLDLAGTGQLAAADDSAVTDGSGAYTIANVPPGTYTLRDVVPAGSTQSQPGAGAYSVTAVAAQTVTAAGPFGVTPSVTAGTATISGTVYGDANGNGARDAGETGLAGETVYLDTNGNGTLDAGERSVLTDATGTYTFTGVAAGTYTVRDVVPGDVVDTQPTTGSYAVTVPAGATTVNGGAFGTLGTFPPTFDGTPGSITGTAFVDANGSGADDAGDGPRAGATVYLDANGNGLHDPGETTATAAADGTYTIPNLAAGLYTVRQLVPLGDTATAPAAGQYYLRLAAGETASATDFGVQPLPASTLATAVVAPPAKSAVVAGAAAVVRVRVTNRGTAAFAGSVPIDVYVATDAAALTTQDVAAGTVTRPLKLKAGKSAVVAVKFTYPASLATGAYHVVAASVASTTTAPALGTAAGSVGVTAQSVDLAPAVTAPATGIRVVAGKRAAVAVRLANSGSVTAAGTATVTVYATASGVVDAAAVAVGSTAAHPVRIPAGRSTVVRVTITAPTSLAAGSYKLVAVVGDVTTSPADDNASDDTSAAVATR